MPNARAVFSLTRCALFSSENGTNSTVRTCCTGGWPVHLITKHAFLGFHMTTISSPLFRILLIVSLAAFVLSRGDTLRAQAAEPLPDYVIKQFGNPPAVPDGPLSEELKAAVQVAFVDSVAQSNWGSDQEQALQTIVASGDPRLAWIISDLMRFISNPGFHLKLADAASKLLAKEVQADNPWGAVTDHLIAWDIPAPPDYLRVKRAIFTGIVPGWDRIFVEGDIDWRLVSWGGVLIDDRPYDTTDEVCNLAAILKADAVPRLGISRDHDTPLAKWYMSIRSQRLVDGPDEVHRWRVGRNVIKAYERDGTTAAAAGGDLL